MSSARHSELLSMQSSDQNLSEITDQDLNLDLNSTHSHNSQNKNILKISAQMTESKSSFSQLLKLTKCTFDSYSFTFSSLREDDHLKSVSSFIFNQSGSYDDTEVSSSESSDSMNIL